MLEVVSGEPILVGAVLAGAGGIVLWGARTLVETRDKVRETVIALYGNPSDKEPNGLKREVGRLQEKVGEHMNEQRSFNDGFTRALAEHHRLLERRQTPRGDS